MFSSSGGMGSHKHGVSGHASRSPRFRFMTKLEAKRDAEARADAAKRRKPAMFGSVEEAFATVRSKK